MADAEPSSILSDVATDDHNDPSASGRTLVVARLTIEPAARSFAEIVDAIAEMAVRSLTAFEPREIAQVEQLEADSKALLAEGNKRFPDAAERALDMLLAEATDKPAQREMVRRQILMFFVSMGLQSRHQHVASGGNPESLAQLTATMLTVLPAHDELTGPLAALLDEQPYLSSIHETTLIDLAEFAQEEPPLVHPVAGLLYTTWKNLQTTAARTDGELATQALHYLKGENEALRRAACRLLLTVDSGRWRQTVIDDLLQSGSKELIGLLVRTAARELSVEAAMPLLQAMMHRNESLVRMGMMELGHREPEQLRTVYDQHLADGTEPKLRLQIIAGLGFSESPAGLEAARDAFDRDPVAEVRTQALFALSAKVPNGLGIDSIRRAVVDPAFSDARLMSQIALAAENLRHGDDTEFLGIARQLLAKDLLPGNRKRLQKLVAEIEKAG